MKYIKGSFAKDITRQAVIDLFYQFAANKKAMLVSSLPGTSWEFEKHVAKMSNFYSTFTTKEWSLQGMMYLGACENNNKIYMVTDAQDIKILFKNSVKFYSVNAKDLLECFLNGYSINNQEIFYHNTYYE